MGPPGGARQQGVEWGERFDGDQGQRIQACISGFRPVPNGCTEELDSSFGRITRIGFEQIVEARPCVELDETLAAPLPQGKACTMGGMPKLRTAGEGRDLEAGCTLTERTAGGEQPVHTLIRRRVSLALPGHHAAPLTQIQRQIKEQGLPVGRKRPKGLRLHMPDIIMQGASLRPFRGTER